MASNVSSISINSLRQIPAYRILIIAFILLSPFASALRGFSLPIGNLALLFSDLLLLTAFCILCARRINNEVIFLFFLSLYSVTIFAFWHDYPAANTLYLGARKSLFFLFSIYIGSQLIEGDMAAIYKYMRIILIVICAYGLKQGFHMSEFDYALLEVQSADVYTNIIFGQNRAFSFLSSGFHLGMAGCLLLAISIFRKNIRTQDLAISTLALISVYLSLTRTFIIISGICLLIRLLLPNRNIASLAILITSFFLLLELFMGATLIQYLYYSLFADTRFANRAAGYEAYYIFTQAQPLHFFLGFGLGSAGSGLQDHFSYGNWLEPHNVFLKYIFEFGLIISSITLFWATTALYKCSAGYSSKSLFSINFFIALLAIIFISGLSITSVEALPISSFIGILLGGASKIRRV